MRADSTTTKEEEEEKDEKADIKSNNPHLTGAGEKAKQQPGKEQQIVHHFRRTPGRFGRQSQIMKV